MVDTKHVPDPKHDPKHDDKKDHQFADPPKNPAPHPADPNRPVTQFGVAGEPRRLSDPGVLEEANINTHSQDWEIPRPRYVGPPNTTFSSEPEHRGKLVDDGHETAQEEQLRRSEEDEQKRVQHGLKANHASA